MGREIPENGTPAGSEETLQRATLHVLDLRRQRISRIAHEIEAGTYSVPPEKLLLFLLRREPWIFRHPKKH